MGFIDYHGTRESHYDDVMEYAKTQKEREVAERIRRQQMSAFAELMGDEKYASFDAKAILRQIGIEYRSAAELFRSLALQPADDRIDLPQLWKDLWVYTTGRYLQSAGISEEKASMLFCLLLGKCLKLEEPDAEILHFQLLQDSRRYRRHMRAFSLAQTSDFWKMLYIHGKSRGLQNTVARFLDVYRRYVTCMAYLLCLKVPLVSEELEKTLAEDLDNIESQQELLERSKHIVPKIIYLPSNDAGKKAKAKEPAQEVKEGQTETFIESAVVCWDRLVDPIQELPQEHTAHFVRELLFRRKVKKQGEENEMIDDLYAYLKEIRFDREKVCTILPEHIARQIQEGTLPVFEDPSISGLAPGEQVHYIDHGTLFWDEARVENPFTQIKGVMVVTDKRVAFRGARSLDIYYEQLNRAIRYDMIPEVLELECDQSSFYITIPSMEAVYQTLKLIANRRIGGDIPKEKNIVDYGSLVEKADINACIFAYECLESYDFPTELTERIALLVKKLKGLKRTLEFHPERTEETARFLSYYIPEGVRIVVSYYEHQGAELPEQTIQNLYGKIKDSIDTLDVAVEKKILSIYQFETMDTASKADALRQILEQDGYFKANQILTC